MACAKRYNRAHRTSVFKTRGKHSKIKISIVLYFVNVQKLSNVRQFCMSVNSSLQCSGHWKRNDNEERLAYQLEERP